MNPLQQQLKQQAGIDFNPDQEGLDLFAQLIVQECVDKITTYDLVPGHSAKWEDILDIFPLWEVFPLKVGRYL